MMRIVLKVKVTEPASENDDEQSWSEGDDVPLQEFVSIHTYIGRGGPTWTPEPEKHGRTPRPNIIRGGVHKVCKKFNEIGSKMLSRGFVQLEKRHVTVYKRVKSMLPRRESERKAHPLARHSEILQGVETRLSMMNMTYFKYIDSNLVCFIPGKVLDEMRNVLRIVETEQSPPRAHQLLQELRDLSSMAMEHFDEHILPRVKEQIEHRTAFNFTAADSLLKRTPRLLYAHNSLSNEVYKVKKQSKTHKHNITFLAQSTQKLCTKLRRQNLRLKVQSRKLKEQERKIQEQNTKIQEQEATLADIKKHIDEWDQKYADLTTELVRARDEILSAATNSRANTPLNSVPVSPTTGSPKFFRTNIKPRVAHILPKGFNLHLDLERKRKSNLLPEIPLKRNRPPPDNLEVPSQEPKDKWKKMKLPDLIDFMPSEQQRSSEVTSNKEVSNADRTTGSAPSSSALKFSRADIGSMISCSLENFLKNNPLMSQITSRKRKITEDIDLK